MATIPLSQVKATQLLASTLSLGKSTNPLLAILVRQALRAQDARPNMLAPIESACAKLAIQISKASNLADEQSVLMSEEAVLLGLDAAVLADVEARTLLPTLGGFIMGHSNADYWESSLDTAAREVSGRIRRATTDDEGAKQIGRLVRGILANDKTPFGESDVGRLVDQTSPSLAPEMKAAIQSFASGSPMELASIKAISGALVVVAGAEVTQQVRSAVEQFEAAKAVVDRVDTMHWKKATFSEKLGNVQAGAAMLSGLLGTLGADKEAKVVADAAKYMQAASQVIQCASLLMNPVGGFGAALALTGMVSGVGGLAMLGGPGGDSGEAKKMQAEVLAAIGELKRVMLAEFAKVNAKLVEMTKMLEEILQVVHDTQKMVERVERVLVEVDRKADLLLLRVDQTANKVIAVLQEAEQMRCQAEASEGTILPARVRSCVEFYASVAVRASTDRVYAWRDVDLALAARLLDRAYSAEVSDSLDVDAHKVDDGKKHRWLAIGLMARLLQARNVPMQGVPTNEPLLSAAVANLAELYRTVADDKGTNVFEKVKDQALLRDAIRRTMSACSQHERFMHGLRGDACKALVNSLLVELEGHLTAFKRGCDGLRSRLLDDMIDKMANGNAPGFAHKVSQAFLQGGGDMISNWHLFSEGDAAADPGVRMLMTFIPVPGHPGGPDLRIWSGFPGCSYIKDSDYCRLEPTMIFNAKLYGQEVMVDHRLTTLLLFDGMQKTPANWDRLRDLVDGQHVVQVLELTRQLGNGEAGRDTVRNSVRSVIQSQPRTGVVGRNIWDIQRNRLRSTGILDRAFAEAIKAPASWGPQEKDLESFEKAWTVVVLLRTVLATAYDTAYNECDLLRALFEGNTDAQFMNGAGLVAWANTRIDRVQDGSFALRPASFAMQPDTFQQDRFVELDRVVSKFLEKNSDPGVSIGFECAKNRLTPLAAAYDLYWP